MSEPVLIALLSLGAVAVGGAGTVLGHWLAGRASRKAAEAAAHAQAETAAITAAATVKTSEDTAQDRLIDQLQEELHNYRNNNDQQLKDLFARVERLEEENRGYRAFIGIQRDHMAQHGIPLPPWPEGLPR